MFSGNHSTTLFSARSLVLVAGLASIVLVSLAQAQAASDNCKIECYPNTKLISGKGNLGSKSENCRWILRTDGKPARLCDHIKCRKVCPGQAVQDQLEAASSGASEQPLRIEQRLVDTSDTESQPQPMGIMRHLHGSKIAKAPVAGVQGGRLATGSGSSTAPAAVQAGARRMAPTLPPAVQYDENDTPPPISRFLDISPEE